MPGTIRGRFKLGLGTATFGIRCATPSLHRIGSEIFGDENYSSTPLPSSTHAFFRVHLCIFKGEVFCRSRGKLTFKINVRFLF